jgi:hypothetical protein
MLGMSNFVCREMKDKATGHIVAGVLELVLGMHKIVQLQGREQLGYNWLHKHWGRTDTALEVERNYEAQLV